MKEYEMMELAAHRAYQRGIQTGSGGNLSARIEGGMIVKSSGGSFGDCWKDGRGFVTTDLAGNPLPGCYGKPTREVYLHSLLYQISDEIGGVMHCHSPWSIAWSYSNEILPMTTLHAQLKLGCDIPVVNIPNASVRPEDEWVIRNLFETIPSLKAFILTGHGIVAVGKDVLEAEHTAELIEETAQIAMLKYMGKKMKIF